MKDNVDVLLATYNGATYLEEMLQSLLEQQDVVVNLIVSDDGSIDDTLKILKSYETKFSSFQINKGPGNGPAKNFLSMLPKTRSPFIAFADQDDIWNPNHLKHSIRRIKSEQGDIPILTFSQVSHFGDTLMKENYWPNSIPSHFSGYFAQNFARGCTIVFNRRLKDILIENEIENMIMHDWWALLIALGTGKVMFEPAVEVLYRIHANNYIGFKGTSRFAFLKEAKPRRWAPLTQIKDIRRVGASSLSEEFILSSDQFISGVSGPLITRLSYAIGSKHKLRQSVFDELILRIGIIAYPLIFDA